MAVTFNEIELQDLLTDVGACGEIGEKLGETLYTRLFVEGDVAQNYDVETGVKCGGFILTDNAVKEYDGLAIVESCVLPEKDLSLSFGAEKWNPIDIGRRFNVCYKDIAKGVKKILGDPSCENTPYMPDAVISYFEAKIMEMANNNIFARIWLGETASTTDWLEGFDGFAIQLQAKLAADNKIALTQNAGATYATQTVTPEQAYNYMQSMYWKAVGLGIDDLVGQEIKATRELVNGYFQYVTTNKIDNAFANYDGMMPAYNKMELSIGGIPIKQVGLNELVKFIPEGASTGPFNNGTKYIKPNMALLAPKDNLKIGTCNEASFKAVKVWFDQKEREQNFDVEEISLDAKIVNPNQMVLLY